MTITEFTQIGTLILATVTASLALQTFRKNKKQELENQLFKIKLDAFSNIVFELDNFFICLSRGIIKLHDILEKDNAEIAANEMKKYSFEIDEQMYKCHTTIVKHSVYFSRKSLDALLRFTDNLLGDKTDEVELQITNPVLWIENYYSKQVDISNNAVDQLREELQLEKLHHSLYKRAEK